MWQYGNLKMCQLVDVLMLYQFKMENLIFKIGFGSSYFFQLKIGNGTPKYGFVQKLELWNGVVC